MVVCWCKADKIVSAYIVLNSTCNAFAQFICNILYHYMRKRQRFVEWMLGALNYFIICFGSNAWFLGINCEEWQRNKQKMTMTNAKWRPMCRNSYHIYLPKYIILFQVVYLLRYYSHITVTFYFISLLFVCYMVKFHRYLFISVGRRFWWVRG